MNALLSSTDQVIRWIRELATSAPTYAPQPVGDHSFAFRRVAFATALSFDGYTPTVVPPGKRLSPAREELVRFGRRDNGTPHAEAAIPAAGELDQILAGVRPCDLRGIHLMDMTQRDGACDPNYAARRQHTRVIGYACAEPCYDRCFCDAVGALDFRDGADVMLTPSDGELVIEVNTEAGAQMVDGAGFASCDDVDERLARARAARPSPFGRRFAEPAERIPALLAATWDAPLWTEHVRGCFSCGTCNMVCPTCYCFDVRDEVAITDPSSGARVRSWDSCMLPQFAAVAGGHNFRPDPEARQRHRVKRKFEYLDARFGAGSFCVGCGRCGRQCTADIDIFDIVSDVVAHRAAPDKERA
jgi:ferredoxin